MKPASRIRARVGHCRRQGRLPDLQAAREVSAIGARVARGLERGIWLCPVDIVATENNMDAA